MEFIALVPDSALTYAGLLTGAASVVAPLLILVHEARPWLQRRPRAHAIGIIAGAVALAVPFIDPTCSPAIAMRCGVLHGWVYAPLILTVALLQ